MQVLKQVFLGIMCICCCFLIMANVSTAHSEIISATPNHVTIGQQLRYTLDPTEQKTLPDLLKQGSPQLWLKNPEKVANFGFDRRTYWFFFELQNNGTHDINRILELSYPLLDQVDFFIIDHQGTIKHIHTGDMVAMSNRAIHHRHFLVPLDLNEHETTQIFVKVKTTGSLQVPLDLWSTNEFFKHDQALLLIELVMLGILVGLGVYNLFLFFSTKNFSYFCYVMTIFSMSMMLMSLYGLSAQFIWQDHPEFNNLTLVGAIGSSLSFSSLFAYLFLRVWRLHWLVKAICIFFILSSGLMVILNFLIPYGSLIRLATLASVVEAIGAMSLGVYLWYKGDQLAKFYTIAWGAFLMSIVFLVLSKWGFFPSNIWTEHALQVGYVAEGFLLSFALAYRMNIERSQRDQARQAILDMQREANEVLEIKVQERTFALERLNQSLHELSTHDGLTGVYNRIFFEEKMRSEWKRGSRATHPICLLMIDGDFFKTINDQYGHLCGDECLKHMAQQCEKTVNRAGDFVARYGGEEFVVLLSSTSLTGASLIAEKIRRNIQNNPFVWNDKTIPLTVSIGVSSMNPLPLTDSKTLISQADQACYAAKASGRNAVYIYREDNHSMVALQALLKDRSLPDDLPSIDFFLT